ncbi:hypothetical protein L1267_23540 [Pseudoalteromonas sp. OFAV1]|uniref:hypothetical protein n=1 Tax=Pseudoalteromonas sp. OFAV1 TaxID=2908892 RepID=UPI001F34BB0B|nr:hypothetical protein [Pseudoalteromonas sp. OFAV1]MCF2903345.1 hypothetical protein [Pseudoalteromonas sp. OFAV1]
MIKFLPLSQPSKDFVISKLSGYPCLFTNCNNEIILNLEEMAEMNVPDTDDGENSLIEEMVSFLVEEGLFSSPDVFYQMKVTHVIID